MRRRADRKWRNTNSQQDLRAFKVAHNHTTYLMNSARRDYFSNLIAENSSNQRKLFCTTDSLLFETTDVSFPDHIPPDDLANNFGNYFVQKIERINDSLDALQSSGLFTEELRQALVLPTLKKCGLDIAYENFYPVSNLLYVSKLSERAAAGQLIDHMTINGLHLELQSAYKKHHSTESALLKVRMISY